MNTRIVLGLFLLLAASVAALARTGDEKQAAAAPAKPKLEYLHQEVKADVIVTTLNDLDGQGWEVFQVIPSWAIKQENGETVLVASGYQIFGRRPVAAAK